MTWQVVACSSTTRALYRQSRTPDIPAVFPRACCQTWKTDLFLLAAALSLCLLFLNQFPTCVGVRPVDSARCRLRSGSGYGSWRYDSRSRFLVRSLKQCDRCCCCCFSSKLSISGLTWASSSTSQTVLGAESRFRILHLSMACRVRVTSVSRLCRWSHNNGSWAAACESIATHYRRRHLIVCCANVADKLNGKHVLYTPVIFIRLLSNNTPSNR